jgi:hypothetical protein
MPLQRTPLTLCDGNTPRKGELSEFERGRIIGMHDGGAKKAVIQRFYSHPYSTVTDTIRNNELRNNGHSIPRSGAPKCYTDAEERLILRHVRRFPKDTYEQVITACAVTFKKGTIKKILKEHGIKNWKCKRRPFLTQKNANKRLAWCLAHRHLRPEEWGMYIWSDECSAERGRGKRDEWCFRTTTEKWQPRMVQTYGTNKNMKVMVWGCFWDTGRSNLYIMDRDFESAKHGYSAASYLEVLEAEVAPIYATLHPGYLFMQDNASIHTARKVKRWFLDHGISQLMDWPPYSPDLNPIEHIWWALKTRCYEMFPEVAADKSESEHARQRLESCLQAAWDTLDQELFDKLGASMCDRIEAVIAANGWHTKY